MPTNIQSLSTADLINLLVTEDTSFTPVQIGNELASRIVPNDYAVTEMRGGTRPTHTPNP